MAVQLTALLPTEMAKLASKSLQISLDTPVTVALPGPPGPKSPMPCQCEPRASVPLPPLPSPGLVFQRQQGPAYPLALSSITTPDGTLGAVQAPRGNPFRAVAGPGVEQWAAPQWTSGLSGNAGIEPHPPTVVPLQLSITSPHEVELQEILGKGCAGSVYLGKWRGQAVAIKVITLLEDATIGEEQVRQAEQEAALGICLNHPNIAATLAAFTVCTLRATSPEASPSFSGLSLGSLGARSRRQLQPHHLSSPSALSGLHSSPMQRVCGSSSASAALNGPQAGGADAPLMLPAQPESSTGFLLPMLRKWETSIVMELCTRGTLRTALDAKQLHDRGRPKLYEVLPLAWEVACTLQYLHANGIVHGDIKAANIMLSDAPVGDVVAAEPAATAQEAGSALQQQARGRAQSSSYPRRMFTAKVADFGHSKQAKGTLQRLHDAAGGSSRDPAQPAAPACRESTGSTTAECVTPSHAAPELLAEAEADLSFESDCYSFGVLLWELYTGLQPYFKFTVGEVLASKRSVPTEQVLLLPDCCPRPYAELCRACWRPAGQRLQLAEVVTRLLLLCRHMVPHEQLVYPTAVNDDGSSASGGEEATEQVPQPQPQPQPQVCTHSVCAGDEMKPGAPAANAAQAGAAVVERPVAARALAAVRGFVSRSIAGGRARDARQAAAHLFDDILATGSAAAQQLQVAASREPEAAVPTDPAAATEPGAHCTETDGRNSDATISARTSRATGGRTTPLPPALCCQASAAFGLYSATGSQSRPALLQRPWSWLQPIECASGSQSHGPSCTSLEAAATASAMPVAGPLASAEQQQQGLSEMQRLAAIRRQDAAHSMGALWSSEASCVVTRVSNCPAPLPACSGASLPPGSSVSRQQQLVLQATQPAVVAFANRSIEGASAAAAAAPSGRPSASTATRVMPAVGGRKSGSLSSITPVLRSRTHSRMFTPGEVEAVLSAIPRFVLPSKSSFQRGSFASWLL